MANALTFLKNYQKFGHKIRHITAETYYEKMIATEDASIKKVMMIRITEELIASTEDLFMWLAALKTKVNFNKKIDNVWEYLLVTQGTDDKVVDIIKKISKARTGLGLYKKFDLPPLSNIETYLKIDQSFTIKLFDNLLLAIKESFHNRIISRKVMQRFHNKIKHGMVVQDYGNELYILDLRYDKLKRRKRRYLILPLDQERAKKMIGTIEVNSSAIHFIVILFMADYAYKIEQKKISGKPFTKIEINFLKESLVENSEATKGVEIE